MNKYHNNGQDLILSKLASWSVYHLLFWLINYWGSEWKSGRILTSGKLVWTPDFYNKNYIKLFWVWGVILWFDVGSDHPTFYQRGTNLKGEIFSEDVSRADQLESISFYPDWLLELDSCLVSVFVCQIG